MTLAPRRRHVLLALLVLVIVAVPVAAHAVTSRLATATYSCRHSDQMFVRAETFEAGRPASSSACLGTVATDVQVREEDGAITMTFPDLDRAGSGIVRAHLRRDVAFGTSWRAASFSWPLQVLDTLDVFARIPKYDTASVPSTDGRGAPATLRADHTTIDLDPEGHLRVRFTAPVTVDDQTQIWWRAIASQQ